MTARALKEWTVSNGDFERSHETDYENKFIYAKGHKKSQERGMLIAFSISGVLIVLSVLEFLTRY